MGSATQSLGVAAVPLDGPASAAREVGGAECGGWGPGLATVPTPLLGPGRLTRAVLQPVTVGAGDLTAATPAPAAQATGVATQSVACVCVRPATQALGVNSVSPGPPTAMLPHTGMHIHAPMHICAGVLVLPFCPRYGQGAPPLSSLSSLVPLGPAPSPCLPEPVRCTRSSRQGEQGAGPWRGAGLRAVTFRVCLPPSPGAGVPSVSSKGHAWGAYLPTVGGPQSLARQGGG